MSNHPYIRDVVTIDDVVKTFYDRSGDGPVFLLGRVVQHRQGVDLRVVPHKPVVIVADLYDGRGGRIDASGPHASQPGVNGAHGAPPVPARVPGGDGNMHPAGPGGSGVGGTPGADGQPGASVTVVCRRSIGAHVVTSGGNGTAGGSGGNGASGVGGEEILEQNFTEDLTPEDLTDDVVREVHIPGKTIPGTPGGDGGGGGAGGAGGAAGAIVFRSITDDTPPLLEAASGVGGAGGGGGRAGADGAFSESFASDAPPGAGGSFGGDGPVELTTLTEEEYVAGLRPLLDSTGPSFANHWAPYRLVTADYRYHRHNTGVPDRAQELDLAVLELERTLELQPDNGEALRLKAQLVGVDQAPPGAEPVWLGGGTNALGLSPDLDLLPSFEEFNQAFVGHAALALQFLSQGIVAIVGSGQIDGLAALVGEQRGRAADAQENTADELGLAQSEKKIAEDEVELAQQQLDQTTVDIQAAAEAAAAAARDEGIGLGDVLKVVAEVGAAVVSIAAAIPTAGASLVALVPQAVSLANAVLDSAGPAAKALLEGSKVDDKLIRDAYDKVDKSATSVIKAGRSIISFVTLVQQLDDISATQDDAAFLDLVKQGAVLTHEVLLAQNRVTLAQQRVDATQARLARADGAVQRATDLGDALTLDAVSVRRAGLLAVEVAQAKAEALLTMAFRAARSVEIYTLQEQQSHLALDAGLLSPDVARAYWEATGEIDEAGLVQALVTSWSGMLNPTTVHQDYLSFFARDHDQDWLRLSFPADDPRVLTLRTRHRLSFRVEPRGLPRDHVDAKAMDVRVALVGARHPNGVVSCEIGHGGRYEQRRADGEVAVQLLQSKVSTRDADLVRLPPGTMDDDPLTEPGSLAFWGRGVGGRWWVEIPERERPGLDLTDLSEVQVWIRYQFLR